MKQRKDSDYEIIFDEEAIKFLERLPKNICERIWNKLNEAKTNPFNYFEKLVGINEFKLRVGDYRVIAEILRKEIIIYVLYVGHRRNVYK